MFSLFFSMTALAQEHLPEASSTEKHLILVMETVPIEGRRPEPSVELILSRPTLPTLSTEQLLQDIDDQLEESEEKHKLKR
ncbi:MAG: hypothetical protein ACI8S6_003057 [Myxococcota bacterium]